MARDYTHHRRGGVPLGALAAILVAILAAGAFGWAWVDGAPARLADAKQWTVKGPPCQTVDAGEYQLRGGAHATKVTNFGVKFTREYGHIECTWLGAKDLMAEKAYVVCQFTGPNVIKVEAGKGASYFVPGVGEPATVEVRQGVARCVMGSNFHG